MRYTCLLILALVAVSVVSAAETRERFITFSDVSAAATQPVTVDVSATTSDEFYLEDSTDWSIAISVATTEAVTVAVDLLVSSVLASGTTTYQPCDSAVQLTITADYDKAWKITPRPAKYGKLRFNVATPSPSQYYIHHLKLLKTLE